MSDATVRYEFMAQRFYRDTGLMAPGKDAPASMPENREERRAAWDEWVKSPKADMARGAFEERGRIIGRLTSAWECLCDSYHQLPDNDDAEQEPHEAAARHVFDVLMEAAEDEP